MNTGEPRADRIERRSGNDRRSVGDRVIRKTFRRIAHDNLLLEVDAEPFGSVLGSMGKSERSRGDVAAVAWNRKSDTAEVRRVRRANQMHCSRALGVEPAAIHREQRPRAIVFKAAGRADARFL